MRKLPVYIVLDCSGSMSGEPIQQLENGVQMLASALRTDPQALETAYISVITFDSTAQVVSPLEELGAFQPPSLQATGTTSLGAALELVTTEAQSNKSTGDYKPMVFIMTDGVPTDDWRDGLATFKSARWGAVVGCSVNGGDTDALKQIAGECVLELNTTDENAMAAFFQWVSASIGAASKEVQDGGGDVSGMDDLPPPPEEIQVVA